MLTASLGDFQKEKQRVIKRLEVLQELQQLRSLTSEGQQDTLAQQLQGQGIPDPVSTWLDATWKGTPPKRSQVTALQDGALTHQTVTLDFERIAFAELFDFVHRLEEFSNPPWKVLEMTLEAAQSGSGQASLRVQATSAAK